MLRCIWAIWAISAIGGTIKSRQNMKRSGENDPYDPYLVTMKHGWSANMGYTRSFLLSIALSGWKSMLRLNLILGSEIGLNPANRAASTVFLNDDSET